MKKEKNIDFFWNQIFFFPKKFPNLQILAQVPQEERNWPKLFKGDFFYTLSIQIPVFREAKNFFSKIKQKSQIISQSSSFVKFSDPFSLLYFFRIFDNKKNPPSIHHHRNSQIRLSQINST